MWYQKFDTFVLSLGFMRPKSNHSVYYKSGNGHTLIITLYVDDMLFFGNGMNLILDLKSQLSTQFEMKELGVARYILGIELIRDIAFRKLWLS